MNTPMDRPRRRELAEMLRSRSSSIARTVTDEFLERHPDFTTRYGALARVRGEEDADFHLRFLAGAILSDSVPAFQSYARWTRGVLDSRGIGAEYLIENLEQVGRAAGEALSGEEERSLVDRLISAAVQAVSEADPKPGALSPEPDPQDALSAERQLYLQAIRAGERRAAMNILDEAIRGGASVPELYQKVLQPAQYELGRLWEQNEISVATEHMGTAITQFVMAQLYMNLEIPEQSHGNAVVTGVSGELHQIGANMVSDVLTTAGWNVRFLGTQLPPRDIISAVEEHGARLVGISTTVTANLPGASELISELRSRHGSELSILVGGGAYRSEPELWRELGADGFASDLDGAVEAASRFIPKPG